MLSGGAVIVVAFMSVVFLGRKLSIAQSTGVALVFIGVTLVGFASVNSSGSNSIIGIVALLIGMTVSSGQSVLEEHLITKNATNPFFLVGCEGSFGLLYLVVILPVLNFIHCSFNICDHGRMENVSLAIRQLHGDSSLQLMALSVILCLGFMNACGIIVVKESGAVSRSIIDTIRIFLVWMVSLFYGWEKF